MAVRCSACGQWIKTTGGAHICPGSGMAKEELPVTLENNQSEAIENEGDNMALSHFIPSISAIQ